MKNRDFTEAMEAYRKHFGGYAPWDGSDVEGFVKRLRDAVENDEPLPDPDDDYPEGADI